MVFVDEGQHLMYIDAPHKPTAQLDWLKTFTDQTNVLHVLVGNFDVYDFCHLNAQVARRMRDLPFHRYHLNNETGCEEFATALRTFLEEVPLNVGDQIQTKSTPKCTFSGVVTIELKRFLDSGIALVACPDCARTRTLSPRNGVLRFPAHSRRKTRPPVTSQRWAMEKTIWEVVGGERK